MAVQLGEGELAQAGILRNAHISGEIDAHILDLAIYEVGNVLIRALHWHPSEVAEQLDDLRTILGSPLVMAPGRLRSAADLAGDHGLSFYDASWAAADGSMTV